MAGVVIGSKTEGAREFRAGQGTSEPAWVRWALTAVAVGFLGLFIVLPTVNVFAQAFSKGGEELKQWHVVEGVKKGVAGYVEVLFPPAPPPLPEGKELGRAEKRGYAKGVAQAGKTWGAVRMTLGIAVIVVPVNTVFGVAAAWAIAKFRFRGRSLLISLIDLPFSVSPVVAGLVFVLVFGRQGVWGSWATSLQWPGLEWRGFAGGLGGGWPVGVMWYEGVIFTPLAIVMASLFVTFPFVARTLIPVMESRGNEEEMAALSLGASGWQMFWRVTLPNAKWGLLYGVILCLARACGEFGAVSVVSGQTDGNDTMPLRIDKLWHEANSQAAFTVASLLTILAVGTLVAKGVLGGRGDGK